MATHKELKRQLRALRKLKRDTQPQTDARRQLNRQIREVKAQILQIEVPPDLTGEKQKVIEELTEYYRTWNKPILVDFKAYTAEQLKFHLKRLKEKKPWT